MPAIGLKVPRASLYDGAGSDIEDDGECDMGRCCSGFVGCCCAGAACRGGLARCILGDSGVSRLDCWL